MFSTSRMASSTTTPKRDHEAGQHHRVERRAAPVEDEDRCQQRQRHSHDADQRRPHIVKEREHHDDDKNAPKKQCMGQIIDRRRDVLRRPEDLCIDLHVRQAGFHLIQRCLDVTGHLERIAPWILLDDQHQAGAVVYDRIADHPLWTPDELGHIPEDELLPVTLGDGNLSKRFRGRARQDMMDGKPLCGCVDEAARSDMRAAGIAQQPDVQRVRRWFP
jgi:hypothetical protein